MNPPPAAPSPVLDLAAAAALLGVAPRTFRRHCPVQPLRLGRRVVWSRAAIERWLDAEPAPNIRAWLGMPWRAELLRGLHLPEPAAT